MFHLCILDMEEGVVGTGEEGAGLLVVVVRESIRGSGVWTLKLHMDQWSTYSYGKTGLSTGDLGPLAMSPVLALVIEHVELMGPEGLRGCSRNNAGALLLLAWDQLHTRCVLDGWSSF